MDTNIYDIKFYYTDSYGEKQSGAGDCPAQAAPPPPTQHTLPITGYTIAELANICTSSANAPVGYNVINGGALGNTTGTAGNDIIYRFSGFGNIYGGNGNDIICTGGTTGSVEGEGGHDTIYLTSGISTISGGAGDDVIFSAAHLGTIDGDDGNDTVYGHASMGSADGGTGTDRIGRENSVILPSNFSDFEEQFTYTP